MCLREAKPLHFHTCDKTKAGLRPSGQGQETVEDDVRFVDRKAEK